MRQCTNVRFILAPREGPPPPPTKAIAILSGNSSVTGVIIFTQKVPEKGITITGTIRGLKPAGRHGFHIHQFGNLTDGCVSAGPHYNPFKFNHSSHDDIHRHAGDFGNVDADQVNQDSKQTIFDSEIATKNACDRSVIGL